MGTVTVALPPAPDQVRTARLLAVTLARRAGVPEPLLDEVRLAVGEACGRAVRVHLHSGIGDPITLLLIDDDGFEAVVIDVASDAGPARDAVAQRPARAAVAQRPDGARDAAAVGLAILGAVVDDVTIEPVLPRGTSVRMRWPAEAAGAAAPAS